MENLELRKKCDEIYSKYKDALDIIFENKSDFQYQIYDFLCKRLSDLEKETQGKIVFWREHSNKTYIRFLTKSLEKMLKDTGCNKGWHSIIFGCEIENRENTIYLKLCLGPAKKKFYSLKNQILEMARNSNLFEYHKETKINMEGWTGINKATIVNNVKGIITQIQNGGNKDTLFNDMIWIPLKQYILKVLPPLLKKIEEVCVNFGLKNN